MSESKQFYKRSLDLQALGKPIDNDWNNIKPINVVTVDKFKYDIKKSLPISVSYNTLSNTTIKHRITDSTLPDFLNTIIDAFENSYWHESNNTEINYTSAYLDKKKIDETDITLAPKSEYYPKALWFEVIVAKDENNIPVNAVSNEVKKYQSRRLNAYNFLCATHLIGEDSTDVDKEKLEVENLNNVFIKTNDLYATTANVQYVSAIQVEDTSLISAKYANFSSVFSVISSTTGNAISAQNAVNIKNLSGTNLYYPTQSISNKSKIALNNLTANTGNIENVRGVNQILCDNIAFEFNDLNVEYENIGVDKGAKLYKNGIAGYFICDEDIPEGTLVKFGNPNNRQNATMTKAGGRNETELIVHGVVAPNTITAHKIEYQYGPVYDDQGRQVYTIIRNPDYPISSDVISIQVPLEQVTGYTETTDIINADVNTHGIILNNDLKKQRENVPDNSSNGYLKLIHLFGLASDAKIAGPTGIHDISGQISNYHHHDTRTATNWRRYGCCECSGDVAIGAPLYLSDVSTGMFDVSASHGIDGIQIGIAAEETDNGSNYLRTAEYFYDHNITNTEINRGGRRAAVYFNMSL